MNLFILFIYFFRVSQDYQNHIEADAKRCFKISKFSRKATKRAHIKYNFMLTNWHVKTIRLFVARWWTDAYKNHESDCSTKANTAESLTELICQRGRDKN